MILWCSSNSHKEPPAAVFDSRTLQSTRKRGRGGLYARSFRMRSCMSYSMRPNIGQKPKDWWDKSHLIVQGITGLIIPVLIAVIGVWLNQRVKSLEAQVRGIDR